MDLAVNLILGIVAGFLAVMVIYRTIPKEPMAILGAIVIGLLGGWIGGMLADLVGLEAANWIGSLVIAFLAAVLLLLALQRVAPQRN